MTKRAEQRRSDVMEALTDVSPDTLTSYKIASAINPEDPLVNGTLYRTLRQLVTSGNVQVVMVEEPMLHQEYVAVVQEVK